MVFVKGDTPTFPARVCRVLPEWGQQQKTATGLPSSDLFSEIVKVRTMSHYANFGLKRCIEVRIPMHPKNARAEGKS